MTPVLTLHNQGDSGTANAIAFGKRFVFCAVCRSFTNCQHVSLAQFYPAVGFTFCAAFQGCSSGTRSPLRAPISHVIGVSSQPQMGRVDAPRIVTAMQDVQSSRDVPIDLPISETMCARGVTTGDAELPIATTIKTAKPQPAVTGLINFAPKSNFGRGSGINAGHAEPPIQGANPRPLQRRGDFSLPQLYQIGRG